MNTMTPGRYKVSLGTHELEETDKGTVVLKILMHIKGHYDAAGGVVENEFGDTRYLNLYLTEKTLGTPEAPGFVTRALHQLGYDCPELDFLDPAHPEAFSFVGIVADVTCKIEEFAGRNRERWDVAKPKGNKPSSLANLNTAFAAASTAKVKAKPEAKPSTPF